MHFLFLSGHHQVIKNFAIYYKMNCSFLLECCIGMEKENTRSQFYYLFQLGVVDPNLVDDESQRVMYSPNL